MSRRRVPLYYELFFGLSENEKIEQGLQFIISRTSRCSPLVREMAELVLQEIEFFQEFRKSRYKLTIWIPPRDRPNQQQIIAMEQSTFYSTDPLIQELAKAVLEEVKYNRTQRQMGQCAINFSIVLGFVIVLAVVGIYIWAFT